MERDFEKGGEGEVGERSEGIMLLRMCKGKGDGRVDDSYGRKVSKKIRGIGKRAPNGYQIMNW